MVDYIDLILKYIEPRSQLYKVYMDHVEQVADKSFSIGSKLGLSTEELDFIYEAAMLHDIGVVEVDAPYIGCYGKLPYIQHLVAGKKILDAEGLPRHANVAMRHCTPNFTMESIKRRNIPLPEGEYRPQDLYEEIIAFSDMFYTKDPEWQDVKITFEDVLERVDRYEKGTSDEVVQMAIELGEIDLFDL